MGVLGLALLAPTCLVSYFISNGNNGVAIAANITFYVSAILIYLFPSICVALSESSQPRKLFLINLFLGWTLIGWCWAYYLALSVPNDQDAEEELQRQP